jgi:hypothetical protein
MNVFSIWDKNMEGFAERAIPNTRAEGLFVEGIERVLHDAETHGTTWTRLASITIYAMLETLILPAPTAVVHRNFMMLSLRYMMIVAGLGHKNADMLGMQCYMQAHCIVMSVEI